MMTPVMLSVLVSLSILVPSVLSSCCGPERWEAYEAIAGGLIVNGQGGKTEGLLNIAFDATVGKIAVRGTSYWNGHPSEQINLQDFRKGKQYNVYNGNCSIENLPLVPGTQLSCIPSNATKVLSSYLGSVNKKFEFDTYQYRFNNVGMLASVTKDSCVPVAYKMNLVNGFINISIIGMRSGVKDMSVFDVPKECEGLDFEIFPVVS